jgi:hypothetical protein
MCDGKVAKTFPAGRPPGTSIPLLPRDIPAVAEGDEELRHQRVVDGAARLVGLQVALGDVGLVVAAVDQHVVPRLVLRRLAFGHRLVPLLAAEEARVDINDDAAVIEALVVDQCAAGEFGFSRAHDRRL